MTRMAKPQSKSKPTWTDVKGRLAGFDQKGLLDLLRELYAANKENQTFLHARFGLGEDVLQPYKEAIHRWLWPDVFRHQDTSVAKAKQAISAYKKAVGEPEQLAELMVFYCEQAAGFCRDVGYEEEGYLEALVRMFEQVLKLVHTLPESCQKNLITKLERVRKICHGFGYGVGDDMDVLLSQTSRQQN